MFKSKQLIVLITLCVAVAVYFWLVRSGRLNADTFADVHIGYAVLVVLLSLLAMFIPAVRWWKLLQVQNVEISLSLAVRITWASYFATLLVME